MPNSKARQGIPICKAKGHTVCPQYITKKFIKLLSELVVTISVFHKRDWESDGLTTDMSAYRNALSPSPPTIFFSTSSVQSLNCAPLSLALGANMQFPIINLNCETVCATLKIHPCLRFITQSYFSFEMHTSRLLLLPSMLLSGLSLEQQLCRSSSIWDEPHNICGISHNFLDVSQDNGTIFKSR